MGLMDIDQKKLGLPLITFIERLERRRVEAEFLAGVAAENQNRGFWTEQRRKSKLRRGTASPEREIGRLGADREKIGGAIVIVRCSRGAGGQSCRDVSLSRRIFGHVELIIESGQSSVRGGGTRSVGGQRFELAA